MRVLLEQENDARDGFDLVCTTTVAELREDNAEDDEMLDALDFLEAGADEVFVGGGAAPLMRIRPGPADTRMEEYLRRNRGPIADALRLHYDGSRAARELCYQGALAHAEVTEDRQMALALRATLRRPA